MRTKVFVVTATFMDEMYCVFVRTTSKEQAIAEAVIYWYDHETFDKWSRLGGFRWRAEETDDKIRKPFFSKADPFGDGMTYFTSHRTMEL